jgi:hypothetical protein
MPAPNSPPTRIFLSYKSSDPNDDKSAKEIKRILERVSPDAVKVFVSDESVHAGDKWRARISEELNASHYLVFLYTDCEARWDWCLFEVGLFLTTAPEGVDKDKGRIFCIHPVSVGEPPDPLADFQHIKLPQNKDRLKDFLVKVFVSDDPIRKLWFNSNPDLIGRMADEVAEAVDRMAVCSQSLCRYITLRGTELPDLTLSSNGRSVAQAIPDSYIVDTDDTSLQEVFGKYGGPKDGTKLKWKDVKPAGHHSWISELATSMAQYIKEDRIPEPIRSPFKKGNGDDYIPILSEVNRRPDEYAFHVLFLRQTWKGERRTDAVSSFKDLMERLIELIESTPTGSTIRYLAYTPAIGFLAESESLWEKLRDCIVRKAAQIEMICLRDDELASWHGRFEGKKTARPRGRIDAYLIQQANEASKELILRLGEEGRQPIQKEFNALPGFYLFGNSKRAIIVAPVGIPLLQKTEGSGTHKPPTESKVEKVEMFGLDTNVPQIVQDASLTFARFR